MSEPDDRAITTALEMLDGTVCECGHVDSEHGNWSNGATCVDVDGGTCDCTEFRPVSFWVQRADAKDADPA
jgi:hypothetical protein